MFFNMERYAGKPVAAPRVFTQNRIPGMDSHTQMRPVHEYVGLYAKTMVFNLVAWYYSSQFKGQSFMLNSAWCWPRAVPIYYHLLYEFSCRHVLQHPVPARPQAKCESKRCFLRKCLIGSALLASVVGPGTIALLTPSYDLNSITASATLFGCLRRSAGDQICDISKDAATGIRGRKQLGLSTSTSSYSM